MKEDLLLVGQGVMLLLVQWKDGTLRGCLVMVRLLMQSLRSVAHSFVILLSFIIFYYPKKLNIFIFVTNIQCFLFVTNTLVQVKVN